MNFDPGYIKYDVTLDQIDDIELLWQSRTGKDPPYFANAVGSTCTT